MFYYKCDENMIKTNRKTTKANYTPITQEEYEAYFVALEEAQKAEAAKQEVE